jgi:hypothetical protein
MSHDCTGPKNQEFFEAVCDGRLCIQAQSATGLPIHVLEQTWTFRRWDFYGNDFSKPDPWVPKTDFEKLMRATFSDYDGKTWLCSTWEIAKSAGYSRPYTFWRAVEAKNTCTGSEYHFFQDGALRVTAISSYNAGPVQLRAWTREREQQNSERCRLVLVNSGSCLAIL